MKSEIAANSADALRVRGRLNRRRLVAAAILICGVLLSPLASGTTGTVTGILKDQSGKPIIGAHVGLSNAANGVKRNMSTGKNGAYTFPALLEGQYDLLAEANGFKSQSRLGLVVHVNSVIRVDLIMEPSQ